MEKTNQVVILEKITKEQSEQVENLGKQIVLVTENNTISEGRERAMAEQVAKCTDDKAKAERDAVRLKRGRNTWRLIAGIETVILAGIVYLSIR